MQVYRYIVKWSEGEYKYFIFCLIFSSGSLDASSFIETTSVHMKLMKKAPHFGELLKEYLQEIATSGFL